MSLVDDEAAVAPDPSPTGKESATSRSTPPLINKRGVLVAAAIFAAASITFAAVAAPPPHDAATYVAPEPFLGKVLEIHAASEWEVASGWWEAPAGPFGSEEWGGSVQV